MSEYGKTEAKWKANNKLERSQIDIKHDFIAENLDYIANPTLPMKNKAILGFFMPSVDSDQELARLKTKIQNLYDQSY